MSLLSRKYWERDSFDLWSLVHLLSGIILGFIAYFFGLKIEYAFVFQLLITGLWELGEFFIGIEEHPHNRVTDLISSTSGFLFFGAITWPNSFSRTELVWPFILFLILLGLSSLLGWISYSKYKKPYHSKRPLYR